MRPASLRSHCHVPLQHSRYPSSDKLELDLSRFDSESDPYLGGLTMKPAATRIGRIGLESLALQEVMTSALGQKQT
jgi:hypothetical protein